MSRHRKALLAASLAACSAASWAHDSWLRAADAQPGSGLVALDLGNSARYPRSDGPTPAPRIAQSGCVDEQGTRTALLPRGEQSVWLELRARLGAARAAGCWVELKPKDIALTPELVQAYLDDIRAPQAVRAAWAEQQRGGLPWREVYRKFIRIELPALRGADAVDLAALRRPRGFPLELVPVGSQPLRAGAPGEFLALADGRPVAGLPVEFVSRRSPVGVWRQSDADGRIRIALPFGGEWFLRSTVLDVPATPQDAWHSRFANLTVMVR
ncbi:MAG: DUF4198 domain-containing protein [Ramlibacter sp.]